MRKSVVWASLALAAASLVAAQENPRDKTCGSCSVPSFSATPQAPAVAESPGRDVETRDDEIDRRMLAGDRPGLAALLDDRMISIGEDGSVTPREKILDRIRPPLPSLRVSITPSEVAVHLFGDIAVVTAKKKRTWEVGGETRSFEYHEANTWIRRDGQWKLATSLRTFEPPPYAAADVSFVLPYDGSEALGEKDATVVLYEFSDYECPFCRRFAQETFSRIEKEYVRIGRVAVVYRDNPLETQHPRAMAAALAGQCAAAQGKLWAMNERLLRDPVALSEEDFARDAREIGLDAAAFDLCRRDPATSARIHREMKEASALGVRGTPIFVIAVRRPGEATARAVRMIEGAQPFEVFQKTLDGLFRARG